MKPSELIALISARFKAGMKRPLHVEGAPGLGKTQIASQVAKTEGVDFKAVHVPLLQPEDYGFPVISADRTDVSFIVSKDKFPIEGSPCGERGILLLDEINQGDASAMKIIANLMQEREIHGQRLKPGWMIVSTGNRTTDRAGANRLLSHLGNRVTRIELETSLDDWSNWALDNGICTEVVAFVRFRPELLNAFDAQNDINATPRSWSEGVNETLKLAQAGAHVGTTEFASYKGDVGEGPASEFLGFLKVYRNLPSPDAIVLNPTKTKVPDDAATLYALTGALSHKVTGDNFGRIMQYVSRMPSEFQVLFIRDTIRISPKVQHTKDFIAWATGPGAKLLS